MEQGGGDTDAYASVSPPPCSITYVYSRGRLGSSCFSRSSIALQFSASATMRSSRSIRAVMLCQESDAWRSRDSIRWWRFGKEFPNRQLPDCSSTDRGGRN